MKQKITLPIPPLLNNRFAVVRGRMVKAKSARQWQVAARQEMQAQKIKRLRGEVKMSVKWYRRAMRGDIDAPLKALLDAFSGMAYQDDKQVKKLTIERSDEDKHNPRVEVTLENVK